MLIAEKLEENAPVDINFLKMEMGKVIEKFESDKAVVGQVIPLEVDLNRDKKWSTPLV